MDTNNKPGNHPVYFVSSIINSSIIRPMPVKMKTPSKSPSPPLLELLLIENEPPTKFIRTV